MGILCGAQLTSGQRWGDSEKPDATKVIKGVDDGF